MPIHAAGRACLLALMLSQPLLPSPAGAEQPEETAPGVERVLVARPGDTLSTMLTGARVARNEAGAALAALAQLFPPHTLRPGQEVALRLDPGPETSLQAMEVEPEPGRVITVSRDASGWTAQEERAEQQRHLVLAEGEVRGALITALRQAGLPADLALGLIRTIAHQVDFQRDLQPGDRFRVLFERFRDPQGGLLRHGRVLHASFEFSGARLALWRHETATGAEWFDAEGRSLRRALLRTPLDGARISSGFGMRHHPVLGFDRLHQGVDFAAPKGTPVFAAADGRVAKLGTERGYGRIVRLVHANGSETRYAHLSAFARGLKAGMRVRQGEVIGRVGASGMATGPHLHFELVQNGRPVNPATFQPEAMQRLAGAELRRFNAFRRSLDVQLARLAPMQELAAAD